MIVGELWEGRPVSLFGVVISTDFVQDRSLHLQKCPSRSSYVGRYKVDDHPLLVSPLCRLTVPIFDLLADGGFVRLSILGEEVQYYNVVAGVNHETYVARYHVEVQQRSLQPVPRNL